MSRVTVGILAVPFTVKERVTLARLPKPSMISTLMLWRPLGRVTVPVTAWSVLAKFRMSWPSMVMTVFSADTPVRFSPWGS